MNFFNYESQFKIKTMIFPFFLGGEGRGGGEGARVSEFFNKESKSKKEQGIASDTIPSHCTILLTGLIARWILIS